MRRALLVSLAIFACRAPGPRAELPHEAPLQTTSARADSAEEFLVVLESPSEAPDQAPRYQTHRLVAAPGGFRELSVEPGVAASDGERLWTWGETKASRQQGDCECATPLLFADSAPSAAELARCSSRVEESRPAFWGEDQRPLTVTPRAPVSRSSIVAWAEDDFAGQPVEQHTRVALLSVLGPYVSYTETLDVFPCGAAHGAASVSVHTVDLRDGKDGLPWGEYERANFVAQHLETGKRLLCEREGSPFASVEDCLAESEEAPQVTMIVPVVHENRVQTLMQYTVPDCYACSDGLWSSYTSSEQAYLDDAPGFFQPWSTLPAPVLSFLAQHPGAHVIGWSVLRRNAS